MNFSKTIKIIFSSLCAISLTIVSSHAEPPELPIFTDLNTANFAIISKNISNNCDIPKDNILKDLKTLKTRINEINPYLMYNSNPTNSENINQEIDFINKNINTICSYNITCTRGRNYSKRRYRTRSSLKDCTNTFDWSAIYFRTLESLDSLEELTK